MGKDRVQNQKVCSTSYQFTSPSFHVSKPFHSWDIAFPKFDFKIQGQVMGEVKVQTHKVCPTSYPFTFLLFCVNRPSYCCDMFFPIFDFENCMMLHNYRFRHFHRTSNGVNPSSGFSFLPWVSLNGASGQSIMTLHNYMSRQFHRTLNGVNLSSSFRDMHSAYLTSFWPVGKPIWGKWANDHDITQLQI